MLYFIAGKDSFRSSLYLEQVLSFYKKENTAYFQVDFSDKFSPPPSMNDIRTFLSSNTLFSSLKLIVLKNMFQDVDITQRKELWELLKEKNISRKKDIMVVFYESNEVRSTLFSKWLYREAQGKRDFPYLKGKTLEQYIEEWAQQLKIKLMPEARDLLIASFPNDLGIICNSLDKLSFSASGPITRAYLEENLFLPLSSNIFDLLDNIAAKKVDQAYAILINELQKGTFPLLIFKMIVMEFRNILKIKTSSAHSLAEAQKKVSLHPYVVRKTYALANDFSLASLRKIYHRLLSYDHLLKSSTINSETILELLFLDLFRDKC